MVGKIWSLLTFSPFLFCPPLTCIFFKQMSFFLYNFEPEIDNISKIIHNTVNLGISTTMSVACFYFPLSPHAVTPQKLVAVVCIDLQMNWKARCCLTRGLNRWESVQFFCQRVLCSLKFWRVVTVRGINSPWENPQPTSLISWHLWNTMNYWAIFYVSDWLLILDIAEY